MPAEPATHAVVVLAAGASRRLGQPKAQLRRDGETLLARSLRLAAATRPKRIRLLFARQLEPCIPSSHGDRVELIPLAAGGALSDTLRRGLQDLEGVDRALLLPCDLPRLEAPLLERLLALADSSRSGVAVSDHRGRPGIPAVIPAPFSPWIAALQGDRGLQQALMQRPAASLGWLLDPALSADVDTPEQLAAARAQGWIDPPAALEQSTPPA